MLLFTLLTQVAMANDPEGEGAFSASAIMGDLGVIAISVIATLAIMLLATLFVGIERQLAFAKARRQSMAVAAAVVKSLQESDINRALGITKKDTYKASYLAGLLAAGLTEVDARTDEYGIKNAQRAVEKAMGQEEAKLKRGMTILATVASTAPFVGLFGTTFGVINAFAGMGDSAGLANISAGISEALITTAIGIGVAVIGVWVFNYFNSRLDKVREEMISSEADFMDWAHKLIQPPPTPAGK